MMSSTATNAQPCKFLTRTQCSKPAQRHSLICVASQKREGFQPLKQIVACALASVLLTTTSPAAYAGINTDTFKAAAQGVGAKIEASSLHDQSPREIVTLLKDKIIPEVEAALKADNEGSMDTGSLYPASMIKEIQVIKSQVGALDKQLSDGDTNDSNTKSLASSLEQQLNAVKATLGFD